MNISAVVLTRNEEKNIGKCLDSLKNFDDIVVVDDYSEDKTEEIAKDFGARFFQRKLDNDFSEQRNFGLEKVKNEWVLFLDADERVSKELYEEIKRKVGNKNTDGYYIKRVDVIWGAEIRHGESGKVKLLRLAKKKSGKWRRKVHEVWDVKGSTESLYNPLIHYPHRNLMEFIYDINFYSDIHARANLEEGKKSNLIKILLYPKMKFIKGYFFSLGFLDGLPGFVIAVLMSLHSFLSWSKLWLLQRKEA